MAIDLTNIFGNNIKVYKQVAQAERQYVGFPGCNGVVGMNLGRRGNQLVISGILYASGDDYEEAREALQVWLNELEMLFDWGMVDYSFAGRTYYNVVFDRISIIPDGEGKAFYYSAEGWCFCRFVAFARVLV